MLDILTFLHARFLEGQVVELALILETSGSVPRGMGAKLALGRDGTFVGTVGGGAIEQIALRRGADLLQAGGSGCAHYTLSGGEVSNTGMICGGAALMGFACLKPEEENVAALGKAMAAYEGGLPHWLTLFWQEGEPAHLGMVTKDSGAWEGLCLSRPACRREEGRVWYAEPLLAGRCFVFGGGHVGRALVPVLASTGFRPTVVDDRPGVALPEFFPTAEGVLVGDFDHILTQVDIQPGDYVVIMTHGHRSDLSLLAQILKTPAAFIGCLGSKKKAATVRERLADMGFSPEDIGRIHSPVGLPIGGETPAEIAVSIAAQMISVRTQLAGGRHYGAV